MRGSSQTMAGSEGVEEVCVAKYDVQASRDPRTRGVTPVSHTAHAAFGSRFLASNAAQLLSQTTRSATNTSRTTTAMPPRRINDTYMDVDSDSDVSILGDDFDHRGKGKGKGKGKAVDKRKNDKGKGKAKEVRNPKVTFLATSQLATATIRLGSVLYAFLGHCPGGRDWKHLGGGPGPHSAW